MSWPTGFSASTESQKASTSATLPPPTYSVGSLTTRALPLFLNEFQNSQHTRGLETLLLNVYDRMGVAKAARHGPQVRSLPVRAAVIIAGEHLPERPSLANRCLTLRLRADARDDSVLPFLAYIKESRPQDYLVFALALYCGLRRGEIKAL